MQQVEQDRAADAQSEGFGMQVAIGEVEDWPAVMVFPEQPVDPGPNRQGILFKAKRPKHGEAGRLKEETGAHGMRLFETLQHGNAVSGFGEEACRGLSGNAAAYDTDFQGPQPHAPLYPGSVHKEKGWPVGHPSFRLPSKSGQSPPFTTRHWPLT